MVVLAPVIPPRRVLSPDVSLQDTPTKGWKRKLQPVCLSVFQCFEFFEAPIFMLAVFLEVENFYLYIVQSFCLSLPPLRNK